jgi:hypothetical protein
VASEDHLNSQEQPRLFLLKNFCKGDERARIVEYVCARFACELDIGAPQVELLQLRPELLANLSRFSPDAHGLSRAIPGFHLGIAWHENAVELAQHEDALSSLAAPAQIGGIIACDTCLQNIDRHRGNLLLRPHVDRSKARQALVPIDWGACFNAVEPSATDLMPIRERRTVYSSRFLMEIVKDRTSFSRVLKKLENWSGQPTKMRFLIEHVPQEWNVPTLWRDALIEHLLRRVDITLEIFSAKDVLARMFPNWQYSL